MSNYEPPMMIRLELDHMKHTIIRAITGDHLKEQLSVAVEKAIAGIDFDEMVSRIVKYELERHIGFGVSAAIRENRELEDRCHQEVNRLMKKAMGQ